MRRNRTRTRTIATAVAVGAVVAGGGGIAAAAGGPSPRSASSPGSNGGQRPAAASGTAVPSEHPSGEPGEHPGEHPGGRGGPHGGPGRGSTLGDPTGHVVHAESVVTTRTGFQTVDTQAGLVTAVSSTSISVLSADAFAKTYLIAGTTSVHKDHTKSATISDVAVGDRVDLSAILAGGSDTVKSLSDHGVLKPVATPTASTSASASASPTS